MTRQETGYRLSPRSRTAEITDRGGKNRRFFGRREYTVHATGVYADTARFTRTGLTLDLLARTDWGAKRKAKDALSDIIAKDAVGVVTWESSATGLLGKRPREVEIYRHRKKTDRSYTIESWTDGGARRKAVRIDKKLDKKGAIVGLSETSHAKFKRAFWERPIRRVKIYRGQESRGKYNMGFITEVRVEAWTNWGGERKGVREYTRRERNRRYSP